MPAFLDFPRRIRNLVGLVGDQQRLIREIVQQSAVIEEARVKALLFYILPFHKQFQFLAYALLRLGIAVAHIHRRRQALKRIVVRERRQYLMRGRHKYRIHDVPGALRNRVELADAVYFAAPKLNANRHIGAHREYVQYPAATAHKARSIHRGFELIPKPPPQIQRFVEIDLLIAAQCVRCGVQSAPIERALHQRRRRRNHD